MLMFLGVVLLVAYTLSFVKGSLFKGFLNNMYKFEFNEGDEGDEEKVVALWKMIGKSCLYLIFAFFISFLFCVFTISALTVDIFLYPTLLVMTLLIGNFFIKLSKVPKMKEEEKKKEFKASFKNQLMKLLYIAYIIYILVLIIL